MTAAPSTPRAALTAPNSTPAEKEGRGNCLLTQNLLLSRAELMQARLGTWRLAFEFPPGGREKIGTTTESCLQEIAVCFILWKTTDSQISALGELCPWKLSGQGLQRCLWCVHRAPALWNGGVREDSSCLGEDESVPAQCPV